VAEDQLAVDARRYALNHAVALDKCTDSQSGGGITALAMREDKESYWNNDQRVYPTVDDDILDHLRQSGIDKTDNIITPDREMLKHDQFVYALLAIKYVSEPGSYKLAVASPERAHWSKAMDSGYDSLMDNDTWVLVDRPRGRNVLKNRWVYVVKYKADGSVDRFKARLVIKGFLQKYGIAYTEIFAPVVRMEVLRLLLAIAAAMDWDIEQMDVKTAFLNGYLDEEIFMEQPEGYAVQGQETKVCRLKKSLYGLKQAPRVWYYTLYAFMMEQGFR